MCLRRSSRTRPLAACVVPWFQRHERVAGSATKSGVTTSCVPWSDGALIVLPPRRFPSACRVRGRQHRSHRALLSTLLIAPGFARITTRYTLMDSRWKSNNLQQHAPADSDSRLPIGLGRTCLDHQRYVPRYPCSLCVQKSAPAIRCRRALACFQP